MYRTNNVTVLGTGVLGGQIAWHSAYKGKIVVAYNPVAAELEKCRKAHTQLEQAYRVDLSATDEQINSTHARLSYVTDLAAAVADADVVIEAVPEIPAVKEAVYREVADKLPERTLLFTNSSSLLPSAFAEASGRPDKYCALHFANLIWKINVIEVLGHAGTAPETYEAAVRLAIELGMVPIPMSKEHTGYILNHWMQRMLNDCQTLVTNGVATPADIDRTYLIVNQGAKIPPFGMIDVIGMGTTKNIWSHWAAEQGDNQMARNAEYLEQNFIGKGKLGLTTGEGYYTYPGPAYEAPDFLAVPDASQVSEIAARCQKG